MFWLRVLSFVAVAPTVFLGQARFPKTNPDDLTKFSCLQDNEAIVVGNYQVRLVDVPDPDPQVEAQLCRAYLVDSNGKQSLLLEDVDVSVHQGTGEDLFGDGTTSLVLEGWSGGAHCCFTYEIVRLGEPPLILSPIENESAFYFLRDPSSGQFRIFTWDGAFDYFDGMCHSCTPFPRVILQVEASGLRNVSSQFVEQYDSEIAVLRSKIRKEGLGNVPKEDLADAKKSVLQVVFAYLYSGREKQAWETLDALWLVKDRERMKKLIIETKKEGLLSKLAQTAPASASALLSPH